MKWERDVNPMLVCLGKKAPSSAAGDIGNPQPEVPQSPEHQAWEFVFHLQVNQLSQEFLAQRWKGQASSAASSVFRAYEPGRGGTLE